MYTIFKDVNNNKVYKNRKNKRNEGGFMESIIKGKNEKKANKGITLIALVITIIVLLILADLHIYLNIPQ